MDMNTDNKPDAARIAEKIYNQLDFGCGCCQNSSMDEAKAILIKALQSYAESEVNKVYFNSEQYQRGFREGVEVAAKIAECHQTCDTDLERAQGYSRAVTEIAANIRAHIKEAK
jgi:hypothetical protein